jgi:hypothetical protein
MKEINWKLLFAIFLSLNAIALPLGFVFPMVASLIHSMTSMFLLIFFGLSFLEEKEINWFEKIFDKIKLIFWRR